jgi:hypothetical protein
MESKKFKSAKDVMWLLAALTSGFACVFARRAGKLEAKEEIAKAVEDKKAKDSRTFVVDDTPIDIDNI